MFLVSHASGSLYTYLANIDSQVLTPQYQENLCYYSKGILFDIRSYLLAVISISRSPLLKAKLFLWVLCMRSLFKSKSCEWKNYFVRPFNLFRTLIFHWNCDIWNSLIQSMWLEAQIFEYFDVMVSSRKMGKGGDWGGGVK